MKHRLTKARLNGLFDRQKPVKPRNIKFKNPKKPKLPPVEILESDNFAFRPRDPRMPQGFRNVGGIPIRIKGGKPQFPNIKDLRADILPRRWLPKDWLLWGTLSGNDCELIPAKTARVDVPVAPLTRMCYMSGDCARIYTVNDSGEGCVVNVLTEAVDANFVVAPNPSPNPPYPSGLPGGSGLVHPFAKGGINHKYKRLYVPASFYTQARTIPTGGFYVAVVDIDPTSSTYLDTISWIDSGWIPEEIAFSDDDEIGVITNYMQGTATIFQASTGAVLDAEVDLFPGAGAGGGGPLARSVRCANVPGQGNRSFHTLTNNAASGGNAGVAIIDLDNPAFPRTNFTNPAFGFITGVAVTPEKDRILLVENGKVHVVRVDGASPVLETTITTPTADGQSHWGGIDTRKPGGNMAFVATGSANSTSPTQGTSLTLVNYGTNTAFDAFTGLAAQTWGVSMVEFGNPLKPHIICCSLSGMVSIIPC